MFALEERTLSVHHGLAEAVENDTTMLGVRCIAHSDVLCMRTIYNEVTDPTQLVRMANILEGGRMHESYVQLLIHEFNDR